MIDWNQVDELRSDMGDAFGEVVEVFLQEVDDALLRLSQQEVGPAMAADLHFLKGAALNLGFTSFAALCAEGEDLANGGRAEQVNLARVNASYRESRDAFLTGLARRAA
ncbi:MAG: Hpt domain-containing protein [Proteobacteria bacterium]|nr:Hpt domain-containing protein [Pseudomonadota bacterium]